MFQEFIQKLKNKEPFSFSRWGDGEWASVLNARTEQGAKNADGHAFFPDMGEALRQVLLSKPKYYLGMQRFALEDRYPNEIKKFVEDNNLQDIQWINADLFHHASIKGYFDEFFEAIKDRTVLLVGPKHLTDSNWHNNDNWGRLEIPDKNCWLSRDKIFYDLTLYLDRHEDVSNESVVVLICAGMPAKWLINELNGKHWGSHTFIDCGSVFDPYVGKASRSYHKKIIERLNG